MSGLHAAVRGPAELRGPFGVGMSVLLAEDDDDMRLLLASMLRRDGFEVIEAHNGYELQGRVAPLFDGEPAAFDAIITDVQMPGVSGLEILAALSELQRRPVVIVITAFGDAETHERARAFGALAIFDKPFDLDDLRTILFNLRPPLP